MELLVFPKTFEQTKDIWKEGDNICVIGKTPKEPGDNKVFVEKVYAVTPENIDQLVRQLTIGMKSETQTRPEPEKYIKISLSTDEVKKFSEDLKKVFFYYPGDYSVYIQVGTNTIKANGKVEWGVDLEKKLVGIISEGKVEIN